jgi:hypothetical protein
MWGGSKYYLPTAKPMSVSSGTTYEHVRFVGISINIVSRALLLSSPAGLLWSGCAVEVPECQWSSPTSGMGSAQLRVSWGLARMRGRRENHSGL